MPPTPGIANIITSVNDDELIPTEFELSAYPNPFNPSTTLRYSIPHSSDIKIKIYNLLGKEIWTKDETQTIAGMYEVVWNGVNNSGSKLSSGIYFVRIQANQQSKNLKLLLIK